MSIENPYESPQTLTKPRQNSVPPPASCGYTLAVIVLGIVAGVMFTAFVSLIVVLIARTVFESFI